MSVLVSGDCNHEEWTNNEEYLFGEHCKKFGAAAAYADDTNYTMAGTKHENLLSRVSKAIKDNRTYCSGNYLKLNEEKMSLLRVTTSQEYQKNPAEAVILEDIDEYGEHVKPKEYQSILGVTLS